MKEIEDLKENILDNFDNWVDTAFIGVHDNLGIQEDSKKNFRFLIENLVSLCMKQVTNQFKYGEN